jgi:hypothetical protein
VEKLILPYFSLINLVMKALWLKLLKLENKVKREEKETKEISR